MILKDLRVRGLMAAGALLIAAACGGGEEPGAAATPAKNDGAAAPATAAAPNASLPNTSLPNAATPSAPGQPAVPGVQPGTPALDKSMTPSAAAAAAAAAPSDGPVTTQALDNYRLTMPKLRALVQAGQNIGALQARRPELRDSMRIPTMDPNLLYQKLNGIADAREAVNRAGITPEEYAIATSALIQATVVHEMRRRGQTPKGHFNETNARFVAENWEQIQALMRTAAPPQPSGQRSN